MPYAIWFVVVTVITQPWRGGFTPGAIRNGLDPEVLGGNYAERPYTTFWFLTALFIAVMVYRALWSQPRWVLTLIVAAGLVVNLLFGEELADVPFSIASALGALCFLSIGQGARWMQDRLTGVRLAAVAAGMLILGLAITLTFDDFEPFAIKNGVLPLVATFVAALICAGLLMHVASVTRLPAGLERAVIAAARPSMVIIVLHPVMLFYFRQANGDSDFSALQVALAFLVPFAVGLMIVRTPLSNLLAGVPREGRRSV